MDEVQDPEKAAKVIQEYKNIIKAKKKEIVSITYHQGKVSKKFKDREKFVKLVSQLGIHKTTVIFKINVFKLCEKYPKLLRTFIGSGVFKNCYKGIKTVCKENKEEFL